MAVDGSEHTKRMLSYVAAHEELLGPAHEYILCTVVAPIPPNAKRFLDHGVLDSYYEEQWDRVLRPLQRFVSGGYPTGCRVCTRHPCCPTWPEARGRLSQSVGSPEIIARRRVRR